MPNRAESLAVLLFSFAIALLGFKAKAGTPIISYNRQFHVPIVTLSVQSYWVLGTIAMLASLFFMVVAFRPNWDDGVTKFVKNNFLAYCAWYFIFLLVYAATWLKGIGVVVSVSSPAWIVDLVAIFGFVLFMCIFLLFHKGLPKLKKNRARTRKVAK